MNLHVRQTGKGVLLPLTSSTSSVTACSNACVFRDMIKGPIVSLGDGHVENSLSIRPFRGIPGVLLIHSSDVRSYTGNAPKKDPPAKTDPALTVPLARDSLKWPPDPSQGMNPSQGMSKSLQTR